MWVSTLSSRRNLTSVQDVSLHYYSCWQDDDNNKTDFLDPTQQQAWYNCRDQGTSHDKGGMLNEKNITMHVTHKICSAEDAHTAPCLFIQNGEKISCGFITWECCINLKSVAAKLWRYTPPPCHVCVYINKSLTRTEITISWLQKRISFTKIHEQQLKCFPLVIHNLQKPLFTSRSFPIFKTDGISQRLLENITDQTPKLSTKGKAGTCLCTMVSMSA